MTSILKLPNPSDEASAEEDPNEKLGYTKISKQEHKSYETDTKRRVQQGGNVIQVVPDKGICFFCAKGDHRDNKLCFTCHEKL